MDQIVNVLKKTGKYWIGFVGDSITSCEWVHPNWREIVEYVLKEELQPKFADWRIPSWGIRCFNYGFDGSTTKDVIKILDDKILDARLDLVIVMIGANDKTKRLSLDQHRENIGKILEKLKNTEAVWVTGMKPNRKSSALNYEKYVEVDRKFKWGKIKFIDMFGEFNKLKLGRLFTFKYKGNPDCWHPNQLGNAYIAKIILREVFGVEFDPEKHIKETQAGEKYPGY